MFISPQTASLNGAAPDPILSGGSQEASKRRRPHTPPLVAETLREYGEAVRTEAMRYLPKGEPKNYLYDLLADYPSRGGKMLRPTICIATACAFGAPMEDALPSAVAIELLHNALLIHDDIEDGSTVRRGAPTMHLLHGTPLAINAGDTLLLLSQQPLLRNFQMLGSSLSERILLETQTMAWESAEGQAMELGWRQENRIDLNERDYLVMALKKTAWLGVIHPMRVGALIGIRDSRNLDRFMQFGFFLGVAFQIQDDLLNLESDARYGKERDGDLIEGKRTLMLIHALTHSNAKAKHKLTKLLALPREKRSASSVEWIRNLFIECGSIDFARDFAHGLAGAAMHEFAINFGTLPASRDKAFIENLVTWVFERS